MLRAESICHDISRIFFSLARCCLIKIFAIEASRFRETIQAIPRRVTLIADIVQVLITLRATSSEIHS